MQSLREGCGRHSGMVIYSLCLQYHLGDAAQRLCFFFRCCNQLLTFYAQNAVHASVEGKHHGNCCVHMIGTSSSNLRSPLRAVPWSFGQTSWRWRVAIVASWDSHVKDDDHNRLRVGAGRFPYESRLIIYYFCSPPSDQCRPTAGFIANLQNYSLEFDPSKKSIIY